MYDITQFSGKKYDVTVYVARSMTSH